MTVGTSTCNLLQESNTVLEFVTKKRYWDAIGQPSFDELAEWSQRLPDLKHIEDAVALEYLIDYADADIAEVGGGESRILPVLARKNRCVNIDPLAGEDLGPTEVLNDAGISVIKEYVGEGGDSSLPDNAFDCLFSISVLEHLDTDQLAGFFVECERLIRPGGLMLHMIDVYLTDEPQESVTSRIAAYSTCFAGGFEPLVPPTADGDASFRCSYATNPDAAMLDWNRIAPSLSEYRAVSQSCALALGARRSA